MTIGQVTSDPGSRLPARRIDPPFRPSMSLSPDPSLAVKRPDETSFHRPDVEMNCHAGPRSHMALITGLCPTTVRLAVPKLSLFGFSLLKKKTPLSGIILFRLRFAS